MASIEVTRLARDELRELVETRQLPSDTRKRVETEDRVVVIAFHDARTSDAAITHS
jgi:hypothetical protein